MKNDSVLVRSLRRPYYIILSPQGKHLRLQNFGVSLLIQQVGLIRFAMFC